VSAIQGDELGIDRAHEQLAAFDRNAAVIVAAAGSHVRTKPVPVMPELLAGCGVDRIDMVEGRGQEHDAVDDDRRGLHRIEHGRLEHERRLDPAYVPRIDMGAAVKARLFVTAVRMDPVLRVTAGGIEHGLRRRRARRHRPRRRGRATGDLLGPSPGAGQQHDGHQRDVYRGSLEGHVFPLGYAIPAANKRRRAGRVYRSGSSGASCVIVETRPIGNPPAICAAQHPGPREDRT
jgi:hypothetical protein